MGVAYGKTRTPNRYLVAAGARSYSLCLVHHEGATLFAGLPIPNLEHVVMWFGAMFQPGGFVRVLSSV
jgi:hypothetical protein